MKEIKIFSSRSNALKLLLISLLFVAIGYVLLQDAPQDSKKYYFSIFGMIFFGLGIPIGIYKLLKRKLILTISNEGIKYKSKSYNWEDILITESKNFSYQNHLSIYLNTYENLDGSFIKDFQNLKKGSKISIVIDNENIDMIELENLTNLLINSDSVNRQRLIRRSEIVKYNKSYYIYPFLLFFYLFLSYWNIKIFFVILAPTVVAVFIQRWFKGEFTNSKWFKYSEIFALVGFFYIGILGVSIFTFDKITNSIGNKLTVQIESYKETQNKYPDNINEIEEKANLSLIENFFMNRIDYQKDNNEYSLSLKWINSKTLEFDKDLQEWN